MTTYLRFAVLGGVLKASTVFQSDTDEPILMQGEIRLGHNKLYVSTLSMSLPQEVKHRTHIMRKRMVFVQHHAIAHSDLQRLGLVHHGYRLHGELLRGGTYRGGHSGSKPLTAHLQDDVFLLHVLRVCGQDTRKVSRLVEDEILHVVPRRASDTVETRERQGRAKIAPRNLRGRRDGTGRCKLVPTRLLSRPRRELS